MYRVCEAHLRVIAPAGNTVPFEKTLQWWRAVSITVSDLTGPGFEFPTSRSRVERISTRPKMI